MAFFEAWSHDHLVKFAYEAVKRMEDQKYQIENMYDAWDNGDRHEIRKQLTAMQVTTRAGQTYSSRVGAATMGLDLASVAFNADGIRALLDMSDEALRNYLTALRTRFGYQQGETSIHSCSYYCERPECVKEQRDELRELLAGGKK